VKRKDLKEGKKIESGASDNTNSNQTAMSSQTLPSSFPFNNGHNQTINESVTEATYPNSSATISNFSNTTSTEELMNQEWIKILITVFSASIMIFIIIAAIFGNLLVIISVMRVRKLR
jgi:hypothetical protein